MFCNYYAGDFEEHLGDQPIRFFYPYIKSEFEFIVRSLRATTRYEIPYNLRIEYLTENIKVIGPSTNGTKITLHDTFLSFLWSYIYGMYLSGPFPNKNIIVSDIDIGRKVSNYGITLLKQYSEWDKLNLPNPEYVKKENVHLVDFTNEIFIKSINFIILHELAHVCLGHYKEPITNQLQSYAFEFSADTLATYWMLLNTEDDSDKMKSQIGAICSVFSVSYTSSEFKSSKTHPAVEDRLINIMNLLHLKSNSPLWGIAMFELMQWQIINFKFKEIPLPHRTISELSSKNSFFELIYDLKEFKKENKIF